MMLALGILFPSIVEISMHEEKKHFPSVGHVWSVLDILMIFLHFGPEKGGDSRGTVG